MALDIIQVERTRGILVAVSAIDAPGAWFGLGTDISWMVVGDLTYRERDDTLVQLPGPSAMSPIVSTWIDPYATDVFSDYIAITATSDSVSLFLLCTAFGTPDQFDSYEFKPLRPVVSHIPGTYMLDDISLSASMAFPSDTWTAMMPTTEQIYWQITAVDGSVPYTELNGIPVALPIAVGPGAAVHHILYVQSSADCTVFMSNVDDLNTLGFRSTGSFFFQANPQVRYNFTQTSNYQAQAESYLNRNIDPIVDPTTPIRWRVDPPTSVTVARRQGPSTYAYPLGIDGWGVLTTAALASAIELTATEFLYTYAITISSSTGEYTSTERFRPYIPLTSSSRLTAQIVPDQSLTPTRPFTLNVYGLTPNPVTPVLHNLAPDQDVAFNNNSQDLGLVGWDTYRFAEYVWYPTEPFQPASNLIPFYIDVTTATSTTTPKICSYSVSVSALSTWYWGTGDVTETTPYFLATSVDFTVPEWASDTLFNPNYRINNELSTTTTIYRLTAATFNCTISNTSILPANTVTGTFVFDFEDGTTVQPYNFTSFSRTITAPAPKTVTIGCTAYSVSATDWPGAITKPAVTKYINFVSYFPDSEAFSLWPATTWNGTIFVPTVPYTNTYGATAWGYCHTEMFYFSALNNYSGATYYWFISNMEPSPLESFGNYVTGYVTSNVYPSTHPVLLRIFTDELPITMPQYHYDDITGYLSSYPNFGSTYSAATTSVIKEHIRMLDVGAYLGQAYFEVGYNPVAVSGESLVLSGNAVFSTSAPVIPGIANSYTWTINPGYWSAQFIETDPLKIIPLSISDEGNQLEIYKFEYAPIRVSLDMLVSFMPKDPTVIDWCPAALLPLPTVTQIVTGVPLKPFIYTSNKFVLTGHSVLFENLVPELTGNEFTWRDRSEVYMTTASTPYITTGYETPGAKSITLFVSHTSINGGTFTDGNRFDNIVVAVPTFTEYTSAINRVYGQTQVVLPYRRDICEIPPNEWLTHDNINLCFWKLNSNLDYLEYMSRLYADPPSELYGWLGGLLGPDNVKRTYWRVNQAGLEYDYLAYNNAVSHRLFNALDCCVREISGVGDNITFISNGTEVSILSSDFYATEIDSISYKGIGDNFAEVKAIGLDSDNRIYVLDSPKNRIMVYSYNFDLRRWTLMYDWGGLGGANAKTKFRNPQDMYIDDTDTIWVADTDNLRVKKYTRTGSWLGTYWSNLFTAAARPLSVVLDDTGNYVHVLTEQYIVVFDQSGNYVTHYMPRELLGAAVKKIEHCQDGGFFYILCRDRIAKIKQNGEFSGVFGQTTELTYTNLFHDAHRNLYVTGNYFILKYIDKIDIVDLTLPITNYAWPMSAIYIEKDEYQQDWVLNRSFARMWDNIELFRRSVVGHFDYRYIGDIRIPIIHTFSPDEYSYAPFTKEQVYIGVNELVTAPVINRCIDKLFECVDVIRVMISR